MNEIVTKFGTKLQTLWNERLKKVCDFSVKVEYTGKNFEVNVVEGRKVTSAYCASGFQKFILDLTFRIINMEIADIPLGAFLIIDEGTSSADTVNRDQVKEFITSLENELVWQFLLLISHDDQFKNIGKHRIITANIIDYIKDGKVRLAINTPAGKATKEDETKIRSNAILHGVPLITTVAGARASVGAIEELLKDTGISVKSLQQYHHKPRRKS